MKTSHELLIERCFEPSFANKLVALRATPEEQAMIDDYAGRNTEGKLSPEEHEDYGHHVEAAGWLAVLQARARRYLAKHAMQENFVR